MDLFTVTRPVGTLDLANADGTFSVEASDLLLPVGVWPKALNFPGWGAFALEHTAERDGDVLEAVYWGVVIGGGGTAKKLTVWND